MKKNNRTNSPRRATPRLGFAALLLSTLLATACGDIVADCEAQYPRTSNALGATDERLALALSQCSADDQTCDGDEFLTSLAATCIATELGLPQGDGEFLVDLVYHYGHTRVVWNIRNLLYDADNGLQGGSDMAIAAEGGRLLRRGTWSVDSSLDDTDAGE